ncbi:MAG: hypothetical protein HGA87_03465 [Desulfobulbaceae bacterium]|nr:hypothetical protein [Desulfobulbaceae bacterium]
MNGLIDELKKPYFLIIKRHESRGAKLLDKMDGDHLIMALLPAEAIGEIEQIPEAQIRPLSEGMTLAERPVENVWEP